MYTGQQGRSGSGEYSKGHISHSTVEKQRRDRINALIDEVRSLATMDQNEQPCARLKAPMPLQLRELVPSQPGDGVPADGNSDSKRPKHVVLADTIALVKSLQIKVLQHPCACVGDRMLISSLHCTSQAQTRPRARPFEAPGWLF